MKIYTNELGHMTNMAAMSIYGKNLKRAFVWEKVKIIYFFGNYCSLGSQNCLKHLAK